MPPARTALAWLLPVGLRPDEQRPDIPAPHGCTHSIILNHQYTCRLRPLADALAPCPSRRRRRSWVRLRAGALRGRQGDRKPGGIPLSRLAVVNPGSLGALEGAAARRHMAKTCGPRGTFSRPAAPRRWLRLLRVASPRWPIHGRLFALSGGATLIDSGQRCSVGMGGRRRWRPQSGAVAGGPSGLRRSSGMRYLIARTKMVRGGRAAALLAAGLAAAWPVSASAQLSPDDIDALRKARWSLPAGG